MDITALGLSGGQGMLVYNAFSFAVATMAISFVFYLVSRSRVAPAYRSAVTMSAMICGIAAYHYWRMFGNLGSSDWNEGYRYADWLLTVPLLVAELVVVAGIAKDKVAGVRNRLVIAALLMIATGYPGETAEAGSSTRTIWGIISSIFMLYILWDLWGGEVGKALKSQTGAVGTKLNNLRYLLLFTWGVYPIAYILGDESSWLSDALGLSGTDATTAIQVGYTIADVLAKPGYGLLILGIAMARSEAEGYRAA
ncbi:MAG: bacteriorhodopsin [Acidimicrobiia bacterium]